MPAPTEPCRIRRISLVLSSNHHCSNLGWLYILSSGQQKQYIWSAAASTANKNMGKRSTNHWSIILYACSKKNKLLLVFIVAMNYYNWKDTNLTIYWTKKLNRGGRVHATLFTYDSGGGPSWASLRSWPIRWRAQGLSSSHRTCCWRWGMVASLSHTLYVYMQPYSCLTTLTLEPRLTAGGNQIRNPLVW